MTSRALASAQAALEKVPLGGVARDRHVDPARLLHDAIEELAYPAFFARSAGGIVVAILWEQTGASGSVPRQASIEGPPGVGTGPTAH